jgi:hypothetical protein
MIALMKITNSWQVSRRSSSKNEVIPLYTSFNTIELAAEFLEKTIGVKSDEIDKALCEMYGQSQNCSFFSEEGLFVRAENV